MESMTESRKDFTDSPRPRLTDPFIYTKKMSNKRVKRVHISGWLEVFLTDTIVGRIAHYLETPTLFRFLLGVNKELRKKATKSKRWNRIMNYQERVAVLGRIGTRYSEKQNILQKFIRHRLYSSHVCSLCFSYGAYIRPQSYGMKMCGTCGIARGMLVHWDEFRRKHSPPPGVCVSCPVKLLFRHEFDAYEPKYYQEEELYEVGWWRRKPVPKGEFYVMAHTGVHRVVVLNKN